MKGKRKRSFVIGLEFQLDNEHITTPDEAGCHETGTS